MTADCRDLPHPLLRDGTSQLARVPAALDPARILIDGRSFDDLLTWARRYAAQLVLGRHWRNASDEERTEFIDAFYGSLLRKYGDGILEFDQSSLEVLPFRGDETQKRTTVKTFVKLDDGTKVPVNYGLVKRDVGWLMFDVTIEGISYVRNFRTELNAEIQANHQPKQNRGHDRRDGNTHRDRPKTEEIKIGFLRNKSQSHGPKPRLSGGVSFRTTGR